MDPFKEIRPYHDDEVGPVLQSLLANPEFIRSIASFSYPRLYNLFGPLVAAMARLRLRRQLRNVNSVASMQSVIAIYMDKMIEETTSRLTRSGLENLSTDRNYLFISNHRDIAMDPAFVNYMLYHGGFETVYIAIGDNLLKRPFVSDLMRLNRSFIVKRSLKGRELLKSSRQLSEYISHCIDIGRNVWIAQREGRAKNGVDRTDSALLKMLGMNRKTEGLKQAIEKLHVVPVSISYEFDPCDEFKAEELYHIQHSGNFEKDEESDIRSIVKGMVGYKGHVHVSFGTELVPEDDDAQHIASLIDTQVVNNYLLQETNYAALEMLRQSAPDLVPELSELPQVSSGEAEGRDRARQELEKRLAAVDEKLRPTILQMYANPVISRFAAGRQDPFDGEGGVT